MLTVRLPINTFGRKRKVFFFFQEAYDIILINTNCNEAKVLVKETNDMLQTTQAMVSKLKKHYLNKQRLKH